MALKTPFFAAFGPLLFGRPKAEVKTSLQHLRQLDDLYAILGDLFPRKLLGSTLTGTNSRRRSLTPEVTFWAFLAQILSPKTSCREIVHRVEVWWRWAHVRSSPTATATAFCQARQRLPLETLRLINGQIASTLERRVLSGEHLLPGRDVKIVDGTDISMPDTPANQAAWPQPKSQKPGCGFPKLKMVGLFSLASGALLDSAIGDQSRGEPTLFRQLWPRLNEGDVVLADRLFCSYSAMANLVSRGVDTVVRLHQKRNPEPRGSRPLGPNDRLVVWDKPRTRPITLSVEEFALLPRQLTVRLVRTIVTAPGFRTRQVDIATTLLDPVRYPADTLRELYARRWDIELHFAQIKTTLQMDVLRCQKPAMIEKELALHLIAYNFVRALMQKAAHLHNAPLRRLSFKGTLDALRHSAQAIHASAKHPRQQAELIDQLLTAIASHPVPSRPGRLEPRARKRRPKNYQLLTRHRHHMRPIPHRSAYRANVPKPA